jgi:hypothetical protein
MSPWPVQGGGLSRESAVPPLAHPKPGLNMATGDVSRKQDRAGGACPKLRNAWHPVLSETPSSVWPKVTLSSHLRLAPGTQPPPSQSVSCSAGLGPALFSSVFSSL